MTTEDEGVALVRALVEAMVEQTAAINRLAESNMNLVDLIASGMAVDEPAPDSYLDGSPR
jgi:hypothetical protein